MLQMWLRLSLLGLIGAASMLLAPIEQLVPLEMEPLAVRLLAIVQPAILVIAAAALGAWLAPKVSLDAPAVRAWAEARPTWPVLRGEIPAALLGGLAAASVLFGFWAIVRGEALSGLLSIEIPLVTKLLYGGIVEELLLRWGAMSLLVWVAWRLSGATGAVPAWCYWLGAGLASLLFAVGHLPTLFLLVPSPPSWLVALVVISNAIPGLLFGWLYWRRGLEAAMLAHASAHLFAAAALSAL